MVIWTGEKYLIFGKTAFPVAALSLFPAELIAPFPRIQGLKQNRQLPGKPPFSTITNSEMNIEHTISIIQIS